MLKTEQDIAQLIESDPWMMDVLHTARSLSLPDWWICAGFVRSKIWDELHGFNERTVTQDVDVVYFDESVTNEEDEKRLEKILNDRYPNAPWSVKNEARMHRKNDLPPYSSAEDAIANFPETATAIGVKLDMDHNVIVTAPHGIEDVLQLKVKPTPLFTQTARLQPIYETRMKKKNWQAIWPNISIENIKT